MWFLEEFYGNNCAEELLQFLNHHKLKHADFFVICTKELDRATHIRLVYFSEEKLARLEKT